MTDEFRTSKVCSECTEGVMVYGEDRMGTCSNDECNRVADRDVNGGEGIKKALIQLATDGTRPGLLSRDRELA